MLKRKLPATSQLPLKLKPSASTILVFSVLAFWSSFTEGLSSSLSTASTNLPTFSLQSIQEKQLAVLDGAEWASIQECLNRSHGGQLAKTNFGYVNVVVGKDTQGNTVIGMQPCDKDGEIYEESVAKIPAGVKTEDAVATYIASISTVHAVLPRSEQVGGSEASMISGKVVVMGSNELACFAAEGLASFGVDVYLVSTGSPKVNLSKVGSINVVKPAVGSDGVGFSEHMGKFDSLLDTIGNERPMMDERLPVETSDDVDQTEMFASIPGQSSSAVLNLLKTRHNCHTYVSTMTKSQNLVAKEGIFAGPGKADEYSKRVGQPSFVSGNSACEAILPWSDIGSTVENLLESGVIFSAKTRQKAYKSAVRGWTLGDFWEQSTWPRDSAGSAQTRFGLPVVDDPDLDDEPMIAEAPYQPGTRRIPTSGRLSAYEAYDFDAKEEDSVAPPAPVQENPFVHQIAGVHGIQTEILEPEVDCVLFMSAKFCKTCKIINPQYTRMARIAQEEAESPILYAKVETSGRWGKEVGKFFGVDAVPNFILFRKGKRFGSPLSVSRLPSKKIDQAIRLLESGAEWDSSVLFVEDEKKSS